MWYTYFWQVLTIVLLPWKNLFTWIYAADIKTDYIIRKGLTITMTAEEFNLTTKYHTHEVLDKIEKLFLSNS